MELYKYMESEMQGYTRRDYADAIESLQRTQRFFDNEFIITARAKKPIGANEHVVEWFFRNYNEERIDNLVDWLLSISVVDKDWTRQRNSIFYHPLFYKARLKDEARVFISEKIDEAVARFEEFCKVDEGGWHRVHLYDLKCPNPYGNNGYIDADYQKGDGAIIRMVYGDIPDLCMYPIPYRFYNAKNRLLRSAWSEDERELAIWITKNEVFR